MNHTRYSSIPTVHHQENGKTHKKNHLFTFNIILKL